MPEVGERCKEREMLLREWTQCGRRIAKLFDEHPAAPNLPLFEEQIRLARAEETDACRKYYRHTNTHNCV
jgi:hypothetical protein